MNVYKGSGRDRQSRPCMCCAKRKPVADFGREVRADVYFSTVGTRKQRRGSICDDCWTFVGPILRAVE